MTITHFVLVFLELSKYGTDLNRSARQPQPASRFHRKYSHDTNRLGYIDHWGVYIRDAAVALEPTLDIDRVYISMS